MVIILTIIKEESQELLIQTLPRPDAIYLGEIRDFILMKDIHKNLYMDFSKFIIKSKLI